MHQVRYMKSSASESKLFQSHPKGEIPGRARQKDVLNSMYQFRLMKSSASEPDQSPLLVKLYGLPISYRVVFKLLLLVLKALNAKMVLTLGIWQNCFSTRIIPGHFAQILQDFFCNKNPVLNHMVIGHFSHVPLDCGMVFTLAFVNQTVFVLKKKKTYLFRTFINDGLI